MQLRTPISLSPPVYDAALANERFAFGHTAAPICIAKTAPAGRFSITVIAAASLPWNRPRKRKAMAVIRRWRPL
jgi:hypothetical protein